MTEDMERMIDEYMVDEDAVEEPTTESESETEKKPEPKYEKRCIRNEYRKQIAEEFVKWLEESMGKDDVSLWESPWFSGSRPMNGYTKTKYKGINMVWLRYSAKRRNTRDPRWYTFTQIADRRGTYHKGEKWHLKSGSKGEWVEYWSKYDFTAKKAWHTQEEWDQAEADDHDIGMISKYAKVFNGSDIEGIAPWVEETNPDVVPDEAIFNIAAGMKVTFLMDQEDRAYYSPSEDQVHLPARNHFKSSESFNATALHELTHSTGHKSRLKRDIENSFGTDKYAFEELVAELGSCFASEYLETPLGSKEFDNSKAYIQSWIKDLKEKPDTLAKAISLADKAADYMSSALQK